MAPTKAATRDVTAAANSAGPTSGGGFAPRSTRRGYSPDHHIKDANKSNAMPTNHTGENGTARVPRGTGCMPQTYAWIGPARTGIASVVGHGDGKGAPRVR